MSSCPVGLLLVRQDICLQFTGLFLVRHHEQIIVSVVIIVIKSSYYHCPSNGIVLAFIRYDHASREGIYDLK